MPFYKKYGKAEWKGQLKTLISLPNSSIAEVKQMLNEPLLLKKI